MSLNTAEYRTLVLGQIHAQRGLESTIPRHSVEALKRYALDRIPIGGFLTAVLENDLKASLSLADEENYAALPAIVRYIMSALPSECHGRPDKVKAWIERSR